MKESYTAGAEDNPKEGEMIARQEKKMGVRMNGKVSEKLLQNRSTDSQFYKCVEKKPYMGTTD